MTISQTTPNYWDCECDDNYIHPKHKFHCGKCFSNRLLAPDSLLEEALIYLRNGGEVYNENLKEHVKCICGGVIVFIMYNMVKSTYKLNKGNGDPTSEAAFGVEREQKSYYRCLHCQEEHDDLEDFFIIK